MRIPKGTLKKLSKESGILNHNLSSYLAGKRTMSKKRAIMMEKVSKNLGYNFSAEDWVFRPEKIKKYLLKKPLK